MTEKQLTEQDATPTEDQGDIELGIQTLVSIGRMWASHGLRMGRSALQTSARTLDVTAETLSDLAERFEHREGPRD